MFLILSTTFAIIFSCILKTSTMSVLGSKPVQAPKISGGEPVLRGEFPHHVGIQIHGEINCGASIISTLLLLTAAHCLEWQSPKRIEVIAGMYGRNRKEETEQIRAVKAIYLHENYVDTGNSPKNDIAIILLQTPLEYTDYVQNISLPKSGEEFKTRVTYVGWGNLKESSGRPTKLRKVEVHPVSLKVCQRNYKSGGISQEVTDNMLCAGDPGKNSCDGDSGGGALCYRDSRSYDNIGTNHKANPKVNSAVLCGIVSWGNGCGLPGFPGVNTKVSRYIDWIENAEKNMSDRGRCRTDEFYCSSRCIPRSAVCDSIKDCDGGEDEFGCLTYMPCPAYWFRCNKGRCKKPSFICDGDNDCQDASDELKCPTETGTCAADKHQCGVDGRCIPLDWVCNGLFDCDDNSDEMNCTGVNDMNLSNMTTVSYTRSYSNLQKCPTEEFFCSSKCISRKLVCNGMQDCDDGSDEMGCTYANGTDCGTTEFRCNNGKCVPRSHICNEDNDCWDLSDEMKCSPSDDTCIQGEFQCSGRPRCIPESWVSDGLQDCHDNSDERISSLPPFHSDLERCATNHFYCSSGCLPRGVICNGNIECGDGTDEIGCINDGTCDQDNFRCNDGECLPNKFICDGKYDCQDRSDELKCSSPNTTCSNEEFQCGSNGRCIPISWKCNNMTDCDNGMDERECPWSTDQVSDNGTMAITSCASHEFYCPNNTIFRDCVPGYWRCDGEIDCSPPYDEQDCPATTNTTTTFTSARNPTLEAIPSICGQNEFPCKNPFTSNGCVPLGLKCDGVIDCTTGEDEQRCQEEIEVEVYIPTSTIYNISETGFYILNTTSASTITAASQ